MPKTVAFVWAVATLLLAEPASAGERIAADLHVAPANPGVVCAQVISCGTKNGQRKEYPTPCAAKDDGATHIAPKNGPTC
jgi:hypothetical protein